MRTLTITDAKKNLGRWLKAAAQGEEVAIIAGSDIIALRKVEVAALDTSYAEAEYGATPESLARALRVGWRPATAGNARLANCVRWHRWRRHLQKPTLIDPEVFQRLGQLPRSERADCMLALHELQDGFGQPHLHAGLAIRKLRATTFECRGNLKLASCSRAAPSACMYSRCFLTTRSDASCVAAGLRSVALQRKTYPSSSRNALPTRRRLR